MPQFDTEFFSSQIFWTIVSFVVLFVILNRWVLPKVAAILNKRTRLIEEEIAEAKRKREEVDELKLEYADKLAEIDQEAQKIFDESERRIIERRNQIMREWNEEMERKKRAFHEDAEVARQQAIRDIRARSADLIADAAEQLIHQHMDENEARKILEESIEELEKDSKKG